MENERTIDAVDQYILDLPEEIQSITNALRAIILNTSSNLVEEYKWSMPNYSYHGLVCYLQSSKKHVNLGFHRGVELQGKDENQVLQGSGKGMRHIRIKKMEDIQAELFTTLIKEAMELNEK